MTTGQVVAVAQRACRRAERELAAAKRSRSSARMQLARLHWDCTLRDLHRTLVAVGQ